MRIIVAVVALACATRLAAGQTTQAVEARLRELIVVASRRDSAAFLAFDTKLPAEIAHIHAANPRYEWAQLDQAARAKRLSELSASNADPFDMGSLVAWTAFPHRIVDIEPRPDGSGGASSFVTFDYSDPQHAPIYYQTVVRRVVLEVRTDRNLKFALMQVLKAEGFDNLVPRITSARWSYFRTWLFIVGFVGGKLPVSATLQCGQQAAVTRRGVNYSVGTNEIVPQIEFDGVRVDQPSTCFVAIEDAAGQKDAVRFDAPVLSMSEESQRCWPRPEFKDLGLVLRSLGCIGVAGTLADAKEFGVGGNKSEQRDASVGRTAETDAAGVAPANGRALAVGDANTMERFLWTVPERAAFEPPVERAFAAAPLVIYEVARSAFLADNVPLRSADRRGLVLVAEREVGRLATATVRYVVAIDADSATAATSRVHVQVLQFDHLLGSKGLPNKASAHRVALSTLDSLEVAVARVVAEARAKVEGQRVLVPTDSAAAHAYASFAPSVWLRRGVKGDRITFQSDGTFQLVQDGKAFTGKYRLAGDVVTIQVAVGASDFAEAFDVRIVGSTLVRGTVIVWENGAR